MRGVFITGTDTNVGKTCLAAALIRALRSRGVRVGAYKPVCSGAETAAHGSVCWPDIDALTEAIGDSDFDELVCPTRLTAPLAPPVAARLEGRELSLNAMLAGLRCWEERADFIVVEGVGGWLCPLTATETVRDFAMTLGWPVLVIAAQRLGTINHTLLTVESVRQAGLPLVGVALNEASGDPDASAAGNAEQIERYGGGPILGVLRHSSISELQQDETLISISDAVMNSSRQFSPS
ncbi:MAG: dethiobiotin synthase [Planctomycetaceae bacterium]|nr:dethiobiotin synthase [Planctomycetaceae bacterium]